MQHTLSTRITFKQQLALFSIILLRETILRICILSLHGQGHFRHTFLFVGYTRQGNMYTPRQGISLDWTVRSILFNILFANEETHAIHHRRWCYTLILHISDRTLYVDFVLSCNKWLSSVRTPTCIGVAMELCCNSKSFGRIRILLIFGFDLGPMPVNITLSGVQKIRADAVVFVYYGIQVVAAL